MAKRRKSPARAPRGEAVVRAVLAAALAELARAGYGGLDIDLVAARAGVNKTTIYRRWAGKEELARAALSSITTEKFPPPDTGSLRGDVLVLARAAAAFALSPQGQGLLRTVLGESADSRVSALARSLRQQHEAIPRKLVQRAVRRGELPRGVDPRLLFDVLLPSIHHLALLDPEALTDERVVATVELVLEGVRK